MRVPEFILMFEDAEDVKELMRTHDVNEALGKRDYYNEKAEPHIDEETGLPCFWVEVDWSEGVVH